MPEQKHMFGVATKGMIIKDNKLLIVYKSKEEAKEWSSEEITLDSNYEVRRDLPGGRLDFGEDPKTALEREINEEVGLIVDIIKPLDVWHLIKDKFQLIGINYLCIWKEGEVVLSDEHEAYEWLSEEELHAKKWNDLKRYLLAFEAVEGENYGKKINY